VERLASTRRDPAGIGIAAAARSGRLIVYASTGGGIF
jgi:hypothetical protein